MADARDVTLGEVHRLLERIDEELSEHRTETREELRGIRAHLATLNSKTATNTRDLATHEARLMAIDREVRDLKRTPEQKARELTMPSEVKELLELARDARGVTRFGKAIWALLGAGGGAFLLWLLLNGKVGTP